jgi:hypothetical protein
MSTPSPWIAAVASFLLPGLGQLLNGERAKGVAILCITAGIAFGVGMGAAGPEAFRSILTVVVLVFVYLFIWFPAIVDAYQRASGAATSLLSGERRWYVIFMLLAVGPMALPLLWQSGRFSKTAKIIWTAVVVLIALAGILLLIVVGPIIESAFGDAAALLGGSL